MGEFAAIAEDPAFQALLSKRSRLRWSFSGLLIFSYLGYGIVGLQIPEKFASSFFGTAMPWGMALGFFLIATSVAMSLIYVRAINQLEAAYMASRNAS